MANFMYDQSFENTAEVTITHNLGRVDLTARLVIDGKEANDKIVTFKQDPADPQNTALLYLEEPLSGRVVLFKAEDVPLDPANPPVNRNFGIPIGIYSYVPKYTPTMDDFTIGIHTGRGKVTIELEDITKLPANVPGNPVWRIYKISGDANKVKIKLKVPSQYQVQYSMRYLRKIGDGVRIELDRTLQVYWMTDISTSAALDRAEFVNLMPNLDDGTLTLRGEITDLANNDKVWCSFRYRENETAGWTESEETEKTSVGTVTESIPNLSGVSYQTQMLVKDVNNYEFYSSILLVKDALPYYANNEAALADGMLHCWSLQEHAQDGEDGIDPVGKADMVFYGDVTSGSDLVGNDTIYKRVLGTLGYGEANFKMQKGDPYTFCAWMKSNNTVGDHTIFSNGKNVLSLATDGTYVQLELNGTIHNWDGGMPQSDFVVFFVTVDPNMDKTYLYYAYEDSETGDINVDLKIDIHDTHRAKGLYFRFGRGAVGDANHQEYEYLDDGETRTVGIWDRVLAVSQMKDIVANFTSGGLLIES